MIPWPRNIKHVAICGNPKSGKSTIAEMLVDEFGGVVIDDGLILRRALPILTGIPEDWCFSQEGKASLFELGEITDQVRLGLGELGNWLEQRYGRHVMAERAMQMAVAERPDAPFYIYPSCRRDQGLAYKLKGGVVIGIDNPMAPASGNEFDTWDRSVVDFILDNNQAVMNLDALREYVRRIPNLIDAL